MKFAFALAGLVSVTAFTPSAFTGRSTVGHSVATSSSLNMKYKVAVVGGGPSGACAAEIFAQEKSIDTVLFERKLDNAKPCGGAIPLCMVGEFNLPETVVDRKVRNFNISHGFTMIMFWKSCLHFRGRKRQNLKHSHSSKKGTITEDDVKLCFTSKGIYLPVQVLPHYKLCRVSSAQLSKDYVVIVMNYLSISLTFLNFYIKVRKMNLISPTGVEVNIGDTLQPDEYIGMCRREILDKHLRDRAIEFGAEIVNGLVTGIDIPADHKSSENKYTIHYQEYQEGSSAGVAKRSEERRVGKEC